VLLSVFAIQQEQKEKSQVITQRRQDAEGFKRLDIAVLSGLCALARSKGKRPGDHAEALRRRGSVKE
jgi:hypothetical protein